MKMIDNKWRIRNKNQSSMSLYWLSNEIEIAMQLVLFVRTASMNDRICTNLCFSVEAFNYMLATYVRISMYRLRQLFVGAEITDWSLIGIWNVGMVFCLLFSSLHLDAREKTINDNERNRKWLCSRQWLLLKPKLVLNHGNIHAATRASWAHTHLE